MKYKRKMLEYKALVNPAKGIRVAFVTSLAVLGLTLGGCSLTDSIFSNKKPQLAGKPSDIMKLEGAKYRAWEDSDFVYRLQVGDEINVVHAIGKELNQRVKILPDGRIYLPIVGAVKAADQSPDELRTYLNVAYASELRNPHVTVIPTKIGKQKIYVGGEVAEAGVYDMSGTVGVVEAIFAAGGLENSANGEEIVILRRTADDRAMMRTINVDAILSGESDEPPLVLRQYDIVFVPRTTAAEIGVWVEQHITNILPFSRSFSYSLNRDIRAGSGAL